MTWLRIAVLSAMLANVSVSLVSCSKSDEVSIDDTTTLDNGSGGSGEHFSVKAIKSKAACDACTKADPICSQYANICDTLQGDASEGPKAGTSKKKLCEDAMACEERTNCAVGHVSNCYCGQNDGTECLEGKAHGACKAEMEAALESTDPSKVAIRFGQENYAGTVAMWRYQCQHQKCEAQCF